MSNSSATGRDQQAVEQLEIVRALGEELERAMLAITCNAISDLEESLEAQNVLASRLRDARSQGRDRSGDDSIKLSANHPLAKDIADAQAELLGINRVYDAVLRRSSHSASLMASLLSSCNGIFQEASGPRLKHQTWSCRM